MRGSFNYPAVFSVPRFTEVSLATVTTTLEPDQKRQKKAKKRPVLGILRESSDQILTRQRVNSFKRYCMCSLGEERKFLLLNSKVKLFF